MQNINFTTDPAVQAVINNVQSLKEGILSAYQPVSFKELPDFIQISPFPNEACGITIEFRRGHTKAIFMFEVRSPSEFYGIPSNEVSVMCRKEGADGLAALAKLNKIGKGRFGEPLTVMALHNKTYISVDVTELDVATLSCIEKLLRVSGLKPRQTNKREYNFN